MALGIRFTETMRGHVSTTELAEFVAAEAHGRQTDTTFEFTVTATSDDLRRMLDEPTHDMRLDGTVTCPALAPQPMTVSGGTLQLLTTDPDRLRARQMVYRMTARDAGGRTFRVDGVKLIEHDGPPEIWDDTTTLFLSVTETGDGSERTAAKGVVHILPADFLTQLSTMEVTGAATPVDHLRGLIDFGRFFAGSLFDVYGGVFRGGSALAPDGPPRQRRPLRMSPPEVHAVETGDGVALRLTRYQGGAKGPVLLAPGFGTSTLAFSIDTLDTNLPEALFAAGYDVWLFDYRASPDLPSAATQFTLDEVATQDYPAAVSFVREHTGAASVQVMAHCVGSMTFLMAMLAGLDGVRSAVCSALTFYPVSPLANRIRAGLDLGTAAANAGLQTLTTDFNDQRALDRIVDAVLGLVPSAEQCPSPVCRRILGIYGEVYKHDNLDPATHAAMHEMFGIANLSTFNHLALMVREGQIVDAAGRDTYLPHLERLAIPITFVTGAENALFLPDGTLRTQQTLSAANEPSLYDRIVFNTYAHMDLYIGRNAHLDVFPAIVTHLDRHN